MAKIVVCALLLALTSVKSQIFADLFQGYQPFLASSQNFRQIYDDASRRTKTDQNKNNYYRGTTKYERLQNENDRKSQIVASPISSIEEEPIDSRRRKTTAAYTYTTTVKPRKANRRIINSNRRDQVDYNNDEKEYDGKINSISDYYTQRPNYDTNRGNSYYTTNNPYRPGVRPAVVDNRPPITNRPVTERPNFGYNPNPKDDDAIAFPGEGDASPQVTMGPDEDYMSQVEKKRYIELAERMCDKYKALTTKAVAAIPLLPSPEPVRVNVSGCAPVNVPLVVGGRVVKINEFPHMALLGWRKLESAGYSWKCGGSLVSEQFVLTAAHCSFQDRDNSVVNGPPRAVQLGSSYLDDPGALVVKVSSVIRHPKYKQPRSYYDLALVKLESAVKFSEMIKPACLGVPPAPGNSIIATGWGRTEYGGDQSHELRSVSLPVWAMPKCREVLGTSRKLPDGPSSESQVCAGEESGGKDTCQGDSGGPAQVQDGCVWRVVAVTSLGRSCGAAETPGLYATVHRAFVASQIFGGQNSGSNNDNRQGTGNNNDGNRQGTGNNNNDNRQGTGNNNDGNRQGTGNNNNDNRQGTGNNNDGNRQGSGNNNYDNNRQTTQRNSNSNYDNNQNYNRPNNGNNYPDNQYTTQRPDRNNYGSDNQQGTDNRQNYNTQKPNYESGNYGTQRPTRNDNSGIVFNYDRENSQNEYTTRKPVQNNNYNSQNYGNNNYGSNNYGDNNNNRPSNEYYTVNSPWWK